LIGFTAAGLATVAAFALFFAAVAFLAGALAVVLVIDFFAVAIESMVSRVEGAPCEGGEF
jgi:hypothetical protein